MNSISRLITSVSRRQQGSRSSPSSGRASPELLSFSAVAHSIAVRCSLLELMEKAKESESSESREPSQPPSASKFQIIETDEKRKVGALPRPLATVAAQEAEESEEELDESLSTPLEGPPASPSPPPTSPPTSPLPPPRPGATPGIAIDRHAPSREEESSAPPNTPASGGGLSHLEKIMAAKISPLAASAEPAVRRSRFEVVLVPLNKTLGRWHVLDWKEGDKAGLAPTASDRDPMIVLDKKKDGSGNSSKANSLHVTAAAAAAAIVAAAADASEPKALASPGSEPPPTPEPGATPKATAPIAQALPTSTSPPIGAAALVTVQQATPPTKAAGDIRVVYTSDTAGTPSLAAFAPNSFEATTASLMAQIMARNPLNVSIGGGGGGNLSQLNHSLNAGFLDQILPGHVAPAQSPQMQESLVMMAQQMAADAATAGNSGSGQAVVAIDNKIEQAMDLVKTHLMYAVREEVEVLRAKIGDLEKKVVRLEGENATLRSGASAEVLASLPPPPSLPSIDAPPAPSQ